ncbi:MAG: Gfo/Idh/MocA family oxidoreductase [Burkholderiales bacterium]
MSKPLRIAIVGLGKIAVDQHLPTIAAHDDLALVATVSQRTGLPGTPNFKSVEAAVAGCSDIDAFVLCTPPQGRYAIAKAALLSGRHVFLEKPPAATLADVFALTELAKANGVSLFASWHSRYAAAVGAARRWLVDKRVLNAEIAWKEDVRRWHPGQDWIFAAGGMGVFDPGINALSIATHILPTSFALTEGSILVPKNRQAPIAASLRFALASGGTLNAEFDFLQQGPQRWEIRLETDSGVLVLRDGGAVGEIAETPLVVQPASEYAGLYRRFVELVAERTSDVDVMPFVHVADAFMLATRHETEAFHW